MPGPYKGFLTQCPTKQEHTKPRHQPSDRDQRARDRLRNKASAFQAKIKSPAYIALGAAALHTVYQTFNPDFPISFHLSTLATKTAANTILTLYVSPKRQTLYAYFRLLFLKHSTGSHNNPSPQRK